MKYILLPVRCSLFSIFGKHFKNPIESVIPSGAVATNLIITYANPKSAVSYGAELEFRKKLSFFESPFLQNFTVFGNLAYIKSSVDLTGADISIFEEGRPMQGQSPYIINGGLQYNSDKAGLSFTGLVNRIGHRISLVGFQGYPDIYENGRTVIDLQVAKKLFKDRGELKLNVGDILNQRAIFYQNSNDFTKRAFKNSEDNVWNAFRFGTNISVSFSMNF